MRRVWLMGAAALVLGAGQARAQTAPIEGEVHDALGQPLAGANVTLERADGSSVATVTTGKDGHYAFGPVGAGTYAVVVSDKGYQTGTAIVTAGTDGAADVTLATGKALDLAVSAQKLDQARNSLSPETGSSAYTVDAQAVQTLPQGGDTPFSQVLLQTPGVAQDSAASGLMHVRGEHANLQYRINGIQLPEGISGFGQVLDPEIADQMQLIDGALPAQYGFHTAGIVNLDTKNGAFAPGGEANLYGGSHNTFEPSLQYGGTAGPLSYFVDGSLESTDYGIEGPTSASDPLHDHSDQGKGFGYFSYLPDPTDRVSVIAGSAVSRFQVPDNPDQTNAYSLTGVGVEPSADLNENQLEETHFATVALQGTRGQFDYQVAPYAQYSLLHYYPDPQGDLEYNGVASNVMQSDFATGIQGDGGWHVNDSHTLRAGVLFQDEYAVNDNSSAVFSTDPSSPIYCDTTTAPAVACTPETLTDDNSKIGTLAGIYLQDEWKALPDLTVNYGARFDAMDAYVQASQLSPRVGAVYTITPAITLHAGYARTFTPPPLELVQPSSVALFANTTEQPSVTEDDPVKPERAHSFDMGISDQATSQIKLGVDAYYKLSQDLLDEGQFGQALVLTPFNYAKGRVYGTEFTASYSAGPVTAYANLAISRAMGNTVVSSQESFSSDPSELQGTLGHWIYLDHDQTYSGSSGIAYHVAADTTLTVDEVTGSGLRNGFDNTTHLPTYTQVNLGAIQHFNAFDDKGADLRFTIINLLDDPYELRDGSGVGVGAPQWGPRRAFYADLSKKF